MKRFVTFWLMFALGWIFYAPAASAHSISMIEGEALVHRDGVEIKLTVRPEDILLSAGLTLIVSDRIEKAVIMKGVEAHRKYLLDGLVIKDAEGHRLTGKITKVELPEIPDEGMSLDDIMSKTAIYHLQYPLNHPPVSLSFQQVFNSGVNFIPVMMSLNVVQGGQSSGSAIPVPDNGDEVQRLSFNWTKSPGPTTTLAAAPAPATSPSVFDTAVTFVYIQNDQVRIEILMPLAALETWEAIPRSKQDVLEIEEQTAARPIIEQFFTQHNELKIDGVIVKPTLDRVDFYALDSRNLAMVPDPREQIAATTRVGAMLTYSTKGAPSHVELNWTLFNDKVVSARAVVFAYDKGSRASLSTDKPTFIWDSPGAPALPKIDSIPGDQSAADNAARSALSEALLRNIYRGFDYHSESDIYDALARSTQGDLLTDLYLKIKHGLIMQEQGGAVARVKEVKIIKSEPAPGHADGGFVERVTWKVEGTIEHWGHIHTRINEYTADLGIAPRDGSWKIVSMDVVKLSQVQNAVSLRKL